MLTFSVFFDFQLPFLFLKVRSRVLHRSVLTIPFRVFFSWFHSSKGHYRSYCISMSTNPVPLPLVIYT